MIYDRTDAAQTIRQGDIFRHVPRVDISLDEIAVLARENDGAQPETRVMSWSDAIEDTTVASTIAPNTQPDHRLVRAILPVCPVDAIVITQDCDAARADDISLCEIAPLSLVFKGAANWNSARRWAKELPKQGTEHLRWFYLPPNGTFFPDRMAVDFRSIIRIARPNLESFRHQRVGRLNGVAYEHFREKLAEFFRRYPYDPWYPLTKDEFSAYREEYPNSQPFPWQMEAHRDSH